MFSYYQKHLIKLPHPLRYNIVIKTSYYNQYFFLCAKLYFKIKLLVFPENWSRVEKFSFEKKKIPQKFSSRKIQNFSRILTFSRKISNRMIFSREKPPCKKNIISPNQNSRFFISRLETTIPG